MNEFVRLARVASRGEPEFLRALAVAVWESADPADVTGALEIRPGEPDPPPLPAAAPDPADKPVPPRTPVPSERSTVAERLAGRMDAPHGIIVAFANDDIAVAEPVLRLSPVLGQEDLTNIVMRGSREHVVAVAGRWDIGPDLAETLCNYGNTDVLEALLKNRNARVSDRLLVGIGKQAANSVRLRDALLGRSPLPVALITELLDKVWGAPRDTLLKRLIPIGRSTGSGRITIPKETRQSRRFIDASQLAERLLRRRGVDETILAELASQRKQLELLICCARLFDVELETALATLLDPSGLSLATFCRARNLNVDTFSQIAIAPIAATQRDSEDVLAILQLYRRLPVPDAIRAIQLWRAERAAAAGHRHEADRKAEAASA